MRPRTRSRASIHSILSLARWLGPWAGTRVPGGTLVEQKRVDAHGRTMEIMLHRPRQPARGVWLVVPGLHFLGPRDPRLERFCKVLASAGFMVVAPSLPDHLSLVISPNATRDLEIAYDVAKTLGTPSIFSISFGSLPAIELATRRPDADALVVFGGFCDFEATVRYAITGRATHEGVTLEVDHDPLNAPVVYLHLLEGRSDREVLERAWRAMVERTWGREEMKIGRARESIAMEIAAALEGDTKRAFLVGCGLLEGGETWLEEGLARALRAYAWADPRPHLKELAVPIAIVHGRDDDVIPYFEAMKMRAALPEGLAHELHLTGMYGHTGSRLPSPRALATELGTLSRVVRILARSPIG